jgi:DNA-binding NarL/FixJ family response regulator
MTTPSGLRVAIVEDDRRYRSSLEQLFTHSAGFVLAGSFASPPAALAAADRALADGAAPWDIVVMDLEMPHMNGIEATRQLKTLAPGLKVVVLTVFEEVGAIVEAVSAGADGYLLKKARARELVDGIRAVAEGGSPLTPDVARTILDLVRTLKPAQAPGPSPGRFELTEREQQVLRGLVNGLSYKQVADQLSISLSTVRSHILAIYRKLQVHNVAEAVSRAVRQRLI